MVGVGSAWLELRFLAFVSLVSLVFWLDHLEIINGHQLDTARGFIPPGHSDDAKRGLIVGVVDVKRFGLEIPPGLDQGAGRTGGGQVRRTPGQ